MCPQKIIILFSVYCKLYMILNLFDLIIIRAQFFQLFLQWIFNNYFTLYRFLEIKNFVYTLRRLDQDFTRMNAVWWFHTRRGVSPTCGRGSKAGAHAILLKHLRGKIKIIDIPRVDNFCTDHINFRHANKVTHITLCPHWCANTSVRRISPLAIFVPADKCRATSPFLSLSDLTNIDYNEIQKTKAKENF